jgi:predicted kinase
MEAIIFIGIQGAGKSSFYRERFFDTHVRINLDMLKTKRRQHLLLAACIEARQPFVVDNTNVTAEARAHFIAAAKTAGFRVAGYYFRSDVRAALARNSLAGARPVSGEEFNSIMRNMTSRLAGRFETISALEAAAIAQINFNLPADYWTNYSTNLRSLNESQLDAAAKKFVRPGEIVWIVIGDLSKIEAGIRELNIGEVVRLDADGNQVNR